MTQLKDPEAIIYLYGEGLLQQEDTQQDESGSRYIGWSLGEPRRRLLEFSLLAWGFTQSTFFLQ